MKPDPVVLLDSFCSDGEYGASYTFTGFVEALIAESIDQVVPVLERVQSEVTNGRHAAGFVSYEAAAGLDRSLTTHLPGPLPLVWFGIFTSRDRAGDDRFREEAPDPATSEWYSDIDPSSYAAAVETIRELIAAGDTYQVNLTMPLRFRLDSSPADYYRQLCRSQRAPFCAFIDIGDFKLLSASPELFFSLRHGLLTTRPMKGTAPRGRWPDEDVQLRDDLHGSIKDRAENLMIVDLLRNDLAKVAEPGSVRVESLFRVETLPTVHQMTSTVTARQAEKTRLVDLFRALFPCGSITGAPKRRSMEIVSSLEERPRGAYTGAIGFVSPGPEAVFSVAIRTAVIEAATGHGELGVGSGITWDSRSSAEYQECLLKARFAREPFPDFQLLESLLYSPEEGYFLPGEHLDRLEASAGYFRFPFNRSTAALQLSREAAGLSRRCKVRLLLDRAGTLVVESSVIDAEEPGAVLPVALAATAIDSSDPFRYHKTTMRSLFTAELALHPDCADVIFLNERGEVAEGASNNVVVRKGERLVTPPLHCGLLPGVFRGELLRSGTICEEIFTRSDLERAEQIFLVNSVRKWRQVKLKPTAIMETTPSGGSP